MCSHRIRPSWDNFFLNQLPALATRSTCERGRSAAIFVRDNDQLAAGYVGSPSGMPHCDDVGHLWDDNRKHCLRTIHAEQNAMIRALRHGISLRDTTLYCTMIPCFTCAKLLVAIGTYRVVALHRYHDSENTEELFANANVALVVINDTELYNPHDDTNDMQDDIRRHLACPYHRVRFDIDGDERICPYGETWILQHGLLINLDELDPGELTNL